MGSAAKFLQYSLCKNFAALRDLSRPDELRLKSKKVTKNGFFEGM